MVPAETCSDKCLELDGGRAIRGAIPFYMLNMFHGVETTVCSEYMATHCFTQTRIPLFASLLSLALEVGVADCVVELLRVRGHHPRSRARCGIGQEWTLPECLCLAFPHEALTCGEFAWETSARRQSRTFNSSSRILLEVNFYSRFFCFSLFAKSSGKTHKSPREQLPSR